MTTTNHAGVSGKLGYLKPGPEKPFSYMSQPPAGVPWYNCEYEWRTCLIRDARRSAPEASLDSTGFMLADAPSGVTDFYDAQQVARRYLPEVEEMAIKLTGGTRARAFDHQLRKREEGRPELTFGRHGDGRTPAAVGRVHNDYTELSGHRRRQVEFPELAPDIPFVILNFWRPVLNPAIDTPLAVCDARSFPMQDWVAGDLIYPDRIGEIYLGTYSAAHEWFYYPAMQPSETLVFKTFDSRRQMQARLAPHCAFDDPTAPDDAPLRRSIEVRCLVVLD